MGKSHLASRIFDNFRQTEFIAVFETDLLSCVIFSGKNQCKVSSIKIFLDGKIQPEEKLRFV